MNADAIEGEFVETATSIDRASLALRIDEPVRALVSPEEARQQWDAYQRLKAAIADEDDFQPITDKKTGRVKRFPKKSFVKKIQTYFGVTIRVKDTVRDDLGGGHFGFRVTAVAVSPNGREVEASGGCSTFEERFDIKRYDNESEPRFADRLKKANSRAYHDVLSTAETRATNRALMNLIGGGEVTAEERRARHTEDEDPRPEARQYETPPFDRERAKKHIFATINELAKINERGVALKDNDRRHAYLQKLYGKTSLNDLDDEQLYHFERKLVLELQNAKAPKEPTDA